MKYITLTYPQTATLSVQGYMYDHLFKVFLSSGNIQFPNLTSVNTFSNNRTVSGICPAFSGYEYPSQYYRVIDNNNLSITLTSFPANSGVYDIIFFNNAGYTKLSDRNFVVRMS